VELSGIENARIPAEVSEAISRAEAIILCPSNPVVSIGPILAVPGVSELLANCRVPRVAVSPIVGGRALKGPADRMLRSLGHEVSAAGVARMYEGAVDGFVVDRLDGEEEAEISALGMRVLTTDAVMRDGPDRERLAREVLNFCSELAWT
jgi:LPPG:FO 2-phospho-L-lactate transferase